MTLVGKKDLYVTHPPSLPLVHHILAFEQMSLPPIYFHEAIAAIIVYDITNLSSLKAVQKWVDELGINAPPDVVVAIVGNKTDLESERTVTKEMVEAYLTGLRRSGFPSVLIHHECSAKSGQGVHEIFEHISKILLKNALNSLSKDDRKNLAKTHLAWLTLSGCEGTEKNEKKAVKMLEERVKDKDVEAMWILGLCKEYGLGTKQDVRGAKDLFKKSSEGGNKVGQFLMSKGSGEPMKLFDSLWKMKKKKSMNIVMIKINSVLYYTENFEEFVRMILIAPWKTLILNSLFRWKRAKKDNVRGNI